jgi:hypothetical protein
MPLLSKNSNLSNNPDSIFFASKLLANTARENMKNPVSPDVAVTSQMELDKNIAVNYNNFIVTYQEIQSTVFFILDAVQKSKTILRDYGDITSGQLQAIINQFKASTVNISTANKLISSGLVPNQPRIQSIGGSRKGKKISKLAPSSSRPSSSSTSARPQAPLAPARRFTSTLGDTAVLPLTYRTGDANGTVSSASSVNTGFTGFSSSSDDSSSDDGSSSSDSSSDDDSSGIPSTFMRNFGINNPSYDPDADSTISSINNDDDSDDEDDGSVSIGSTPKDVNVLLRLLNRLIQLIRKADYIFTGMLNSNINSLTSSQINDLVKIRSAMNLIWKIFTTPNEHGVRIDFILRLLVQYSAPLLITLHQVIEIFVQDLTIGINKYQQNEPQQAQAEGAGRKRGAGRPVPRLNESIRNYSAKYLL